MKTSNFANLKNLMFSDHYRVVSIAKGRPTWFEGFFFEAAMPVWAIIKAYKDGEMTEEEYTEMYNVILDEREPELLKGVGEMLAIEERQGCEFVLLCWCSKRQFCHRRLFAAWIEKHFGVTVDEL